MSKPKKEVKYSSYLFRGIKYKIFNQLSVGKLSSRIIFFVCKILSNSMKTLNNIKCMNSPKFYW